MAERVFLHVGTPKSGTTYLQAVLWQNADRLKAAGLLLPGRFKVHYAAARGIRSRENRKHQVDMDVDTAWPRLVGQINTFAADAVVSHELLAPATAAQAADAKALLAGSDVHVVITARALHKQLPAAWQEQVKSGLTAPYDVFVQRVRDRQAQGEWFWKVQDIADIAARWGAGLPAGNIHVVTVPADSAESSALWRRFAVTLGIDPSGWDVDVPRKNVSLGAVESEALRQIHAVEDTRFTDRERHQWTRRVLATQILGQRKSPALGLPTRAQPWVAQEAAKTIAALRAASYDVVGDLADLEWRNPPAEARPVASVAPEEVDEAIGWAIGRLQEELMRREPAIAPPPVGPEDGVLGVLDLLEHIRAADSGTAPRAYRPRSTSSGLIRKSITAIRGH